MRSEKSNITRRVNDAWAKVVMVTMSEPVFDIINGSVRAPVQDMLQWNVVQFVLSSVKDNISNEI